jgi:hypothetical protein
VQEFVCSRWLVAGTAVGLLWFAACSRPAPGPQRFPTGSQVVANSQGVGVPYDQYILVQDSEQLIALKITARSPRGEHIAYQWSITPAESGGFRGGDVTHGEGVTSEDPYTGRITVPGLRLDWSKGSSQMGWIYWPERGRDIGVFSRAWSRLDEIDPRLLKGRWLRSKERPD